ncbi:MAG TPA: FAD:protein FMN transferase [Woeseiaceae bacterium]
MGSPCELITEAGSRDRARDLARLVADEVWRIEDKFSRYRDDNIVHRINTAAGRGVEVDEETAGLLDFAVTLYELSDRKFDITSGVLRAVWRFDGSDRVPEPEAVRGILDKVGWDKVSWQRPVLTMPAGMEIDLGGIGKEYAADRAINLLRAAGAPPSLVNLGGDLAVSGPPSNRRAWKVAIEGDLEGSHDRLIELRQGALTTSGDARRYLLRKGVRYGHILDPTTGWPVPDAPRSVTVAADTCTQAGMISTMAMLRGQGAEQFLAEEGIQSWCRR